MISHPHDHTDILFSIPYSSTLIALKDGLNHSQALSSQAVVAANPTEQGLHRPPDKSWMCQYRSASSV